MYGTTDSPLHYGLATDRLVVCLETTGRPTVPHLLPARDRLPILTAFPRLSDVTVSIGDRNPERALIEIPADVLEVIDRSSATAQTWRLAVRDHIQWALSRGYLIAGVQADTATGRIFYLVSRASSDAKDSASSAPIRAVRA
jgi:predicted GNAT superfamily acetyltransferase